MDRSRSKRVARKKVVPLHFQKNQASLSQILSTASYKKRIKELQRNNKALAVALQDTRLDLANCNRLLQKCSNADAKVLLAKNKLRDMVVCIQTLVSGLNAVMCSLDLKPLSLFTSSPDEVKLKIRDPDLDPIVESDSLIEDSNICVSLSDKDSLGAIISEQHLAIEKTPLSSIGLNAVCEDQGLTGRPNNSILHAGSPPLTPEFDATHSPGNLKQFMGLNLTSQSSNKDLVIESEAKLVSPVKGVKSLSRIPVRGKNPLPLHSIDFSSAAPIQSRKTFVVTDAPISSGMDQTCITHNCAQDVMNYADRRGTYVLNAVPEIDILSPIVPEVDVPEATVYLDEDMELTGVLPIHNWLLPKKDTVQTSSTLSSSNLLFNEGKIKSMDNIVTVKPDHTLVAGKHAAMKLGSNKQDSFVESISSKKKPTFKDTSPIFKGLDSNEQDMELTGIPIYSLPPEKLNICVQPEHSVAVIKPVSSKLICKNQDLMNEPILFGEEINVISKDNSPESEIGGSLKRKSVISNKVSFKTKGRKFSDPKGKETLSGKRQSSVNSKETISPKLSSHSIASTTSCRKSLREKSKATYNEYSSDSDRDDETSSNLKKTILTKIPHSPKSSIHANLIETSHDELNFVPETSSNSEVDSASDCNFKDDFQRCNLSPKKIPKRKGTYTFQNLSKRKSERTKINKESEQTECGVASDCSKVLEIKNPSPQNLGTLKRNSISEPSNNADKELPGASQNVSPLQKFKTSNKDVDQSKQHSRSQKSSKLKFADQNTGMDNADPTFRAVPPTIQSRVTRSGSSKIVSPPPGGTKSTIKSGTSTCRKSVQFTFDECYNAFQAINCKEQLISEHKDKLNASKEIGKFNDSVQQSSRLSAALTGILKNRSTSHQKLAKKNSYNTSSSIPNTDVQNDNQLKHSQTETNNKLDEILATLDSTPNTDSECGSKGRTDSDLALQPTKGDQLKRPFSGVSERRSKKRATDKGSDVFIEIENICSQEIPPSGLVTTEQCKTEQDSNNCEETEIYYPTDIKPKVFEAESNYQSKSKSKKLKDGENNIQVQDSLVSDKTKSSNHVDKISCEKDDLIVLVNDKKKRKKDIKNAQVDNLTQIKRTPLKTILLSSTEACSLSDINTQEGKTFDKPKKVQNSSNHKKSKIKSKDPTPSSICELTQIKKENDIVNVPDLQPIVVLEALPICITDEKEDFVCSKSDTSLENRRSKRSRSTKSCKEPSLRIKMRR